MKSLYMRLFLYTNYIFKCYVFTMTLPYLSALLPICYHCYVLHLNLFIQLVYIETEKKITLRDTSKMINIKKITIFIC